MFQSTLNPEQKFLRELTDSLNTEVFNSGRANDVLAKNVLAFESLNPQVKQDLASSVASVRDAIKVSLESINMDMKKVSPVQIQSATIAATYASSPLAFLNKFSKFDEVKPSMENHSVVPSIYGDEGSLQRNISLEAYNEVENKNYVSFTVAYNLLASRQDEFGETFFPTIVVDPSQVGINITADVFTVLNDPLRNVSGTPYNLLRKNITRAFADYTILKNEGTRVIPVYRTESAANFVDPAKVAPYTLIIEDQEAQTAPLKTGVTFDLIGLSQTDALLASGLMERTDSLEPMNIVNNIYVDTQDGVVSFSLKDLPYSNFVRAQQQNYRRANLDFTSTSIMLNANSKLASGAALPATNPIVAKNLIVRFEVELGGNLNIETGNGVVYGNKFAVSSVQDANGNLLSLTSGDGLSVVNHYSGTTQATIIGWDPLSYRSNVNRRQRGQLIDTTHYVRTYEVYLGSAITSIHPASSQTDETSDLNCLVATTKIRISNNAVTTIMGAVTTLASYIDSRDITGEGPDVLGIGKFYVRPVFHQETIDMKLIVDSLSSQNRPFDIQGALVNKIRDYAYKMYRESEYQAASEILDGKPSLPVVVIGTDPVLARYLTLTGDVRLLGDQFEVRVVSTLDYRMQGKIVMSFGVFDNNRNSTIHPLNFGNLLWAPEQTIVLPVSRNGQVSREFAVSPRYRHIVNLPVMTMLQINNVTDVTNKVPVNFHNI